MISSQGRWNRYGRYGLDCSNKSLYGPPLFFVKAALGVLVLVWYPGVGGCACDGLDMRLANPDLSDTHVRRHGISQVARVYFGVITPPLICACV